jgi:hypothetical protein
MRFKKKINSLKSEIYLKNGIGSLEGWIDFLKLVLKVELILLKLYLF